MMKKTDFLRLLREGAKKYRYILIVIAAGLLLLLLPTDGSKDEKPAAEPDYDVFVLDELEASIADALERISGVGKTEVVLTLDRTTETVYQTDSREERDETSTSLESETVFESASGVQSAVVRTRLYPDFRGALVVCEGAGSASIRLEVTRAVEALTGLPSDRITVLKRTE